MHNSVYTFLEEVINVDHQLELIPLGASVEDAMKFLFTPCQLSLTECYVGQCFEVLFGPC